MQSVTSPDPNKDPVVPTDANEKPRLQVFKRNAGLDPKLLTKLERIRLGLLVLCMIGLGLFAWRQQTWNSSIGEISTLLNNEDANSAIEKLRVLEQEWGRSGESCFLRGRAYRYLNQVGLSSLALDQSRALKYDQERLDHEVLLLDVQCQRESIDEATARDVISSYQADVDENGTALVRGLLRINDIFGAHAILSIWNHEVPDSDRLKYLTGLTALRINEFKDAKEAFEKAYEINPDYIPVWLELGKTYWRETQPEKALEFFDKYFAKRPDDPEAEGGRVETLLALGQYEKVDEYFASYKQALDVNGRARIFRAQSYEGLEKYPQVISTLEPLIKVWPEDVAANQMLAVAYQAVGRDEEAAKCAEQSRQSLAKQGAIGLIRQRIAADYQNASLHYELGHLLLHLLSRAEGVSELETALTLDPNIKPAHEDLAYYYSVAGNSQRANMHKRALDPESQQ